MSDFDALTPPIYRAVLPVTDSQAIEIHPIGEILSVAPTRDGRSDQIDLWFTTFETADRDHRRWIHIAGTGHPRPDGRFVGTVVTPSGLVWHVFEGAQFRAGSESL